ncbi:MAG: hypothetical protein IKX98_01705 [Clostridia bacterium]|nr:hypothetical protein [Clostridia bacterium]
MFEKIKSRFHKKEKAVPPRPSWEETVDIMYNKSINGYTDDVAIKVIYSANRERRFIIFKRKDNLYYYLYEYLDPLDDLEWSWASAAPDPLPAIWASSQGIPDRSIFGTEQEAWNDLITTPEYHAYFEDQSSY